MPRERSSTCRRAHLELAPHVCSTKRHTRSRDCSARALIQAAAPRLGVVGFVQVLQAGWTAVGATLLDALCAACLLNHPRIWLLPLVTVGDTPC